MALVKQFALSTGLDEGSNPKAVPPGTLKTGHNVRFDKAGRLSKRWGTIAVGNSISDAQRLIVRGNELSAVSLSSSNATLKTYESTTATWLSKDKLHDVGLSWTTIRDDQSGVRSSDYLLIAGTSTIVHAWVAGNPGGLNASHHGRIYFQVFNIDGTILHPPTLVTNTAEIGSMVRIVRSDLGPFFIVYSTDQGAAGNITYVSYNATTFAQITRANLQTDANSGVADVEHIPFDVAMVGGQSGNRLILLYETTANALNAVLYSQTAGTISAAIATRQMNTAASTAIRAMAVAHIGGGGVERVYAAFEPTAGANSTDVLCSMSTTTASTISALVLTEQLIEAGAGLADVDEVAIGRLNTTDVIIGWTRGWDTDATADQGTPYTKTVAMTSAGALSNEAVTSGVRLLTQIFARGSPTRWFAIVADYADRSVPGSTSDLNSYLIEIFPESDRDLHRYLGKIDMGIAGMTVASSLTQVASHSIGSVDANVFRCPIPFQGVAADDTAVMRCGTRDLKVLFSIQQSPDMWRSVESQREAVYAAGLLGSWDGRIAFDYGMRTPKLRDAATSNSVGTMGPGTYVYQLLGSFHSYVGVWHRGPPSVARTAGLAAPDDTVTLQIASHHLDCKQDVETALSLDADVQSILELYRSVANASVPQKLTYEPTIGVIRSVPSPATGVRIAFTDVMNDSDISGGTTALLVPLSSRPAVYTASGDLDDTQPPAPWTICAHQGRIILVSGSRREVYWSKAVEENPGVAPGFFPTQKWVFDKDVTALASMDDKLVIFSESSIWIVTGEGPDPTGNDNRFSVPRAIQTDVGCTNPRSIVSMPDGIMFESIRGIYLLSRGLETVWIGQPIRDKLSLYTLITSATLVPKENEVRFTANLSNAEAGGSEGIVLVYDYVRKQWLTRSYTVGVTANAPIADAVIWEDQWVFVTYDGRVRKEVYSGSAHSLEEGANYVQSNVRLAPINGDGPMSWYRMKNLALAGEAVSNHRLTMNVYRDYATSIDQTKTFEAGSDVTALGLFERAILDVKNQKGQAYELEIVDSQPANVSAYPIGNGAGYRLEGIALHVMPKAGMPRLSANRRG